MLGSSGSEEGLNSTETRHSRHVLWETEGIFQDLDLCMILHT